MPFPESHKLDDVTCVDGAVVVEGRVAGLTFCELLYCPRPVGERRRGAGRQRVVVRQNATAHDEAKGEAGVFPVSALEHFVLPWPEPAYACGLSRCARSLLSHHRIACPGRYPRPSRRSLAMRARAHTHTHTHTRIHTRSVVRA